jgi:hypothetical protein
MVGRRHLTRHGDVSDGNQPRIRDGVVRGVTQCRRLSQLIRSWSGSSGARQDHDNVSSIASTSHRFTVAKLSVNQP